MPPRSMPLRSSSLRVPQFRFLLALAAAAILYVLILDNVAYQRNGGGEARIAGAFEAIILTAGLWIMLAILLVLGARSGSIPTWAVYLAVPFVPISGIAYLVAIDMFCRDTPVAAMIIVLMPLLIAFYALWARLPRLHTTLSSHPTSAAIWASVCILSAGTFAFVARY